MKVADLMHTPVHSILPDATVEEALVTLADYHISALPVVDSKGRMIGVISSTDLIVAEAEAAHKDTLRQLAEDTEVREIMTPRVLTIRPEADVREAAEHMLYADIHRLFVVEEDRPVGVISASDIAGAVAAGRL
jgi:acetoin utilization protein AcuB